MSFRIYAKRSFQWRWSHFAMLIRIEMTVIQKNLSHDQNEKNTVRFFF